MTPLGLPVISISTLVEDDIVHLETSSAEGWWTTGGHEIDESLVNQVDDAVKDLMPESTEIISITDRTGQSYPTQDFWARTADIETEVNGKPVSYFLKVTDRPSGLIIFASESEASRLMNKAVPGSAPRPLGFGMYKSHPSAAFILREHLLIGSSGPDADLFPRMVAELHTKAMPEDGLYGFHMPTASLALPFKLARSESWEDYFTRYLLFLLRAEAAHMGSYTEEQTRLLRVLFDRLLPRLLRPLETGGRSINPTLCHGDLWWGKGKPTTDGQTVMYDPCPIYAHNEFDLAPWCWEESGDNLSRVHVNNYHAIVPKSAPQEDYTARMILYHLAYRVRVATVCEGKSRNSAFHNIQLLEDLVPETYSEWCRARGEKVCPPKTANWKPVS